MVPPAGWEEARLAEKPAIQRRRPLFPEQGARPWLPLASLIPSSLRSGALSELGLPIWQPLVGVAAGRVNKGAMVRLIEAGGANAKSM